MSELGGDYEPVFGNVPQDLVTRIEPALRETLALIEQGKIEANVLGRLLDLLKALVPLVPH